MRWEKIFALHPMKVGEDSLFNPLFDEVAKEIPHAIARFGSWTKEELLLDHRGLMRESKKVLTNASIEDLTETIQIAGVRYQVVRIEENEASRWRILAVKTYER